MESRNFEEKSRQAEHQAQQKIEQGRQMAHDRIDRLTGKAEDVVDRVQEKVASGSGKVMHQVEQGMEAYNEKIQAAVPTPVRQRVRNYPWVWITAALTLGLFLGMILKPSGGARHMMR